MSKFNFSFLSISTGPINPHPINPQTGIQGIPGVPPLYQPHAGSSTNPIGAWCEECQLFASDGDSHKEMHLMEAFHRTIVQSMFEIVDRLTMISDRLDRITNDELR